MEGRPLSPSFSAPRQDSLWIPFPSTQFTSSERKHSGRLGGQGAGKGEKSKGSRTWVGGALSGPYRHVLSGRDPLVLLCQCRDGGSGPSCRGRGIWRPLADRNRHPSLRSGELRDFRFLGRKRRLFRASLAQSVSCPGLQMKETEVHRHPPSFPGWKPEALHLTTFCIYSLTFCMAPCRVDIKEMTFWRTLVS